MSTTTAPETAIQPGDLKEREPRGYTPRYALASFGLFLAILAPVLGGLSVKIQSLVGLADAPTQLGLVSGVGALFALVSQPLAGRLSDRTTSRFGMRKPWIISGVVLTFVSLVGVGLAPNIPVLLIAWCGAQLFSNFAQAAETATIPDQVPEHRRGRVSGLIGAASPLAILVGAIGLNFLPTDALRASVPAFIGLVFGLLFALMLKDCVLTKKPGPFSFKEFFSSFVFNPRTHKNLGWAWLTKAMIMFGYASISSYLTLFLAADFGMTKPSEQLQFNLYANIVSVVFMVVVSIVAGRMSDRLGRRRAFVTTGGIVLGFGVLILAIAPALGIGTGLVLILVAEGFIGIGGGLFFAVDTALCVDVLPNPNDSAKDLGVLNIANTLPQTIAPFVAGTVVIPLGNALFGSAGYSLWFGVGAAVAIVGGLLVLKIKGVK